MVKLLGLSDLLSTKIKLSAEEKPGTAILNRSFLFICDSKSHHPRDKT